MITGYYRPQSLTEAMNLLSVPHTYPLGGGTVICQKDDETFSSVDLQALGLDKVRKVGTILMIGATVTLQTLLEHKHTHAALKTATGLESPLNLRNMATVAGALVSCDGRSPFAVVMLALDAKLEIQFITNESKVLPYGDYLAVRKEFQHGILITGIEIPVHVKLAFETVARSPGDRPIVCASLAQWPSGRIRLVLGGWSDTPTLAMDGNDVDDLQKAAKNASYDSSDQWASSSYRMNVASILSNRCLASIKV
jgi:CO/xanthine dehydrogenase FAD-binding subunit